MEYNHRIVWKTYYCILPRLVIGVSPPLLPGKALWERHCAGGPGQHYARAPAPQRCYKPVTQITSILEQFPIPVVECIYHVFYFSKFECFPKMIFKGFQGIFKVF